MDLANYQRRPARFTGEALASRRREFEQAQASGQLSGAGEITGQQQELVELYLTGRISQKEYLKLTIALFEG
jgi:hypothetical protein